MQELLIHGVGAVKASERGSQSSPERGQLLTVQRAGTSDTQGEQGLGGRAFRTATQPPKELSLQKDQRFVIFPKNTATITITPLVWNFTGLLK